MQTNHGSNRYFVEHDNLFETLCEATDSGLLPLRIPYEKILACCSQTWDVVKDVLCFDAPEGHVLEGESINEEIEETDAGSKETLSFCWRALKESRSVLYPPVEHRHLIGNVLAYSCMP